MAMKKYTGAESFEVLRGAQAQTLHDFRQKVGKSSVGDFTPEELSELDTLLAESKDVPDEE